MFQKPAYSIEYEDRVFNPELMVRFGDNKDGYRVSTYVWPGLRDGEGELVFRAVVITV